MGTFPEEAIESQAAREARRQAALERRALRASFQQACEVPPNARLVVSDQSGQVLVQHRFRSGLCLLGSDPSTADVVLSGPRIAKTQLGVLWVGGQPAVFDIGGGWPPRWEKGPLQIDWWQPGRELLVGNFRLTLEGVVLPRLPASSPQVRVPQLAADYPQLALRFHNLLDATDELSDSDWLVDRRVTLFGTARWCKIALDDPAIARVEAALVRTEAGLWLVGLAPEQGPIVKSRRVALAPLSIGERFGLGDYEIEVVGSMPAPVAPSVGLSSLPLIQQVVAELDVTTDSQGVVVKSGVVETSARSLAPSIPRT